MRRINILLAVVAATLIAGGCSQQKTNATKVLDAVDNSLADIKDDAARYAPDGLKGVQSQLDRLQASLKNKDYDDVIAGAPQLNKAVDSLRAAVKSGKEHARAATASAKNEWQSLSVEVPKLVDSIQSRVDELSKKKRLPMGVSKDEFEGAKTSLASMKSMWAEASDEFKSGKQVEAAQKAKTVKGMGEELRDQLKIKA
jgi:outer membrane murein-binding lipoprotein Lpp